MALGQNHSQPEISSLTARAINLPELGALVPKEAPGSIRGVIDVLQELKEALGVSAGSFGIRQQRKRRPTGRHFFVRHKGDSILGAPLNVLHNKARVVLNADRSVRLGLNMRYFEVLASGACLLTDNALDLHQYFTDNEHLCVYHDLEDMQRKLRWLLHNDEERMRISPNGFREVTQRHTCDHRVQSIQSLIASIVDAPDPAAINDADARLSSQLIC